MVGEIQNRTFTLAAMFFILLVIALIVQADALQAEEVESGLAVGAFAEPLNVKDCTGPAAGKTVCYFCRYASRPMVAIFVRETSDDVATLISQAEAAVKRHRTERMAAFVVYTGDDTAETEQQLKDLAKKNQIEQTPLTLLRESKEALRQKYRIEPRSAVTVLMLRSGRVRDLLTLDSVEIEAEVLKAFPQRLDALLK